MFDGKNASGTITEKSFVLNIKVDFKFDIDKIRSSGYDIITPVVITNSEYLTVTTTADGAIAPGDQLLKWD